MKTIHILIADDHALMRIGLKSMLHYQKDMRVVGEASNGEEAIRMSRELKPDIVVMDLMMPILGGAEATRTILAECPDTQIIMLTSFGTAADMIQALKYGAKGAQMKEAPVETLIEAIRVVASGGTAIAPEIQSAANEHSAALTLTERQRDILQSVVRGLTNREIGVQFGLSPISVKKYLSAIFIKIGAANRTEAAAIALSKQLIKL